MEGNFSQAALEQIDLRHYCLSADTIKMLLCVSESELLLPDEESNDSFLKMPAEYIRGLYIYVSYYHEDKIFTPN